MFCPGSSLSRRSRDGDQKVDRAKIIKYAVTAGILILGTWIITSWIGKIVEDNLAYHNPATYSKITTNIKKILKKKMASTTTTTVTVASGKIELPDGTKLEGTGIGIAKKEEKKEESTETTTIKKNETDKSTPVFKPVPDLILAGKSVNTGDAYLGYQGSFLFGTRIQGVYSTDLSGDLIRSSKAIVYIGIPLP
jgi:hypothetical protein